MEEALSPIGRWSPANLFAVGAFGYKEEGEVGRKPQLDPPVLPSSLLKDDLQVPLLLLITERAAIAAGVQRLAALPAEARGR
jgi:hypothetical protein